LLQENNAIICRCWTGTFFKVADTSPSTHYFMIVILASMRQCIDCSCHTSFNRRRRVTNRRSESASLMTPTNNNKHNMERKINMMSKQQKYGAKCMFLINKDYYFYNEANRKPWRSTPIYARSISIYARSTMRRSIIDSQYQHSLWHGSRKNI
jgi:hypothetical protein